jgi:hypothetical protein
MSTFAPFCCSSTASASVIPLDSLSSASGALL